MCRVQNEKKRQHHLTRKHEEFGQTHVKEFWTSFVEDKPDLDSVIQSKAEVLTCHRSDGQNRRTA